MKHYSDVLGIPGSCKNSQGCPGRGQAHKMVRGSWFPSPSLSFPYINIFVLVNTTMASISPVIGQYRRTEHISMQSFLIISYNIHTICTSQICMSNVHCLAIGYAHLSDGPSTPVLVIVHMLDLKYRGVQGILEKKSLFA